MDTKYDVMFIRVAGVTFEGRQSLIAKLRGSEPVRLVPEPTNKYDANAIAVHVAMADKSIAHVGYCPRELSARLAPLLDGESIDVTISEITGGFEMWDGSTANYGLVLRLSLLQPEPNNAPMLSKGNPNLTGNEPMIGGQHGKE